MASADALSPNAQVPLNTIPISPSDENNDPAPSTNNGATDEAVTVLHDKDNFNVKHPLMHEWTLWFTKPPSGKVRPLLRHACAGESTGEGPKKMRGAQSMSFGSAVEQVLTNVYDRATIGTIS